MRLIRMFRPTRLGSKRGQLASFLVLILAFLVLLTVFQVNVGQVVAIKTQTANAADAATLALASQLGTVARELSLRLGSGTKYEDKKCKINWGAIWDIVLTVVYAVIGFFEPTFFINAAEQALSLGLSVVETQKFHSSFNRLNKLNIHDAIQESTMRAAFLAIVDDPEKVKDDTDIDDDGDREEFVSRFAHQYDIWLDGVEANTVKFSVPEVTRFVENLSGFGATAEQFLSIIDREIIPMVQWTETLGYNQVFWMPGEQGCDPTNPQPDPNLVEPDEDTCPDNQPCGLEVPPIGFLKDEVDCLKQHLNEFIEWLAPLVALDDADRVQTVEHWEAMLKEGWQETWDTWKLMIDRWIFLLALTNNRLVNEGFWPPDPNDPNPPPLPPIMPGPFQLPLDPIIERLRTFQQELSNLKVLVSHFQSRRFSGKERTYSWQDHRGNQGWHHVQVIVEDFGVPRLKSSGFFNRCIKVKNKNGYVSVTVKRYDQDAIVSRSWALRLRTNPSQAEFAPGDAQRALQVAVGSSARAYYGRKPATIALYEAR